jgi:hypothetical protein
MVQNQVASDESLDAVPATEQYGMEQFAAMSQSLPESKASLQDASADSEKPKRVFGSGSARGQNPALPHEGLEGAKEVRQSSMAKIIARDKAIKAKMGF